MPAQLPPLVLADLPDRRLSFWRLAGPGAVLVGLSIGAGELIIWPRIAAQFGGGMVWAAVVGVFLQTWVNLEIGRYTIATGETVYTGLARLWRGTAPLFFVLTILGYAAPGWAMASGLAVKGLIVGPAFGPATSTAAYAGLLGTQTFWTLLTFAGVTAVLFGPRLMYQSMERVIEILVVVVTLGLVVVAAAVGTTAAWRELGQGLANIASLHVDEGIELSVFFGALVFAGAGGITNLFYSFYLRDKNIGMGARLPALVNPLRGRHETIPATGYQFPDTPANAARFGAWMRYVRQDQVIFFLGLNCVTILLFIFGALAVLHPRGLVPGPNSLIFDQAEILGQVWGGPGRLLFLVVGIATLFGTQLALVDGVARSLSDIIYTQFPAARRREMGWWYLVLAGSAITVSCALTAVMETFQVTNLGFIFHAAYMGGFAMAIYVPMTLYLNLRRLPHPARPGPLSIAMMSLASAVYVGFAVCCLLWELGLLNA